MTDRLYTLAEVQQHLGIGKTRMYELINNGDIETVDISSGPPKQPRPVGTKGPRPSRRITAKALSAFIERNRVPAP